MVLFFKLFCFFFVGLVLSMFKIKVNIFILMVYSFIKLILYIGINDMFKINYLWCFIINLLINYICLKLKFI